MFNTQQADAAELATLQSNGGCTSNPSYCAALEEGIDQIQTILWGIEYYYYGYYD